MIFTRLERYIIKKFLVTFFFSIVLIMSIAIVFDFAERLDDFLEKDLSLFQIFTGYYIYFAPYFAHLFLPLFVFISVIYFTSKLTMHSELNAMFTSGISFHRLLRPYMFTATIIVILSVLLGNFIIPYSTKKKLDFEFRYIRNPYRNTSVNIHRQIEPGLLVYMENYSVDNDIAYKFSLEKFKNGKLVSKLLSDYAQWDSTTKKWRLFNCFIRNYYDTYKPIKYIATLDTLINLKPEMFNQREEITEAMDYFKLRKFIKQKQIEGDENINYYKIIELKRFINPLCAIVLTLIGISVSSRKVRGGTGLHIGLGLALSFSYIVLMQIFTNMSIGSNLPPWLGVSIPTIVYFFIAIYMYIKVPK
ncbi:MAG: LptF/LptG family permease [Bacteroidales bacterium]|nr:LptF/LptG family permease [Bacteroidales bacterium]